MGRAAGGYAGPGLVKLRYPYPAAAVEKFVDACATTPRQRPVCVCTIDRLQRTLPYRDYQAADAAVRADRPAAPETRRVVDRAAAECRDAR